MFFTVLYASLFGVALFIPNQYSVQLFRQYFRKSFLNTSAMSDRQYYEDVKLFFEGVTSNKFTHQQIQELVRLYRFRFNPNQEYTQCGSCIRRMLKSLRKDLI